MSKTKGAASVVVENMAAEMPPCHGYDPMDACLGLRDLAPLVSVIDSAHRTGETHATLIVDLQHAVIRVQHEAADLRAEVNALRAAERAPSWRTVAAGALDGLAAMLRGSW